MFFFSVIGAIQMRYDDDDDDKGDRTRLWRESVRGERDGRERTFTLHFMDIHQTAASI